MGNGFTPEHLCARQIMQKYSDFEICSIGIASDKVDETYLDGLESGLRSMKAFGLIKDFNIRTHRIVPTRIFPRSTSFCPGCGVNLTEPEAVCREYINKTDDDRVGVLKKGHYDLAGTYEPDTRASFGKDRFDLLDDSDTCSACGAQL